MKTSSLTLDRVLHHILMEEEVGCFTIMELRDRYLKLVDPNGFSLPDLRVYLYDQIRRMVACSWAAYHTERKTRGQRFLVLEKPENLIIKLHPPAKGMQERRQAKEVNQTEAEGKSVPQTPEILATAQNAASRLQQMLKETRLDLMTSYGETERFAQMIQDLPGLKTTLEPELIASRDNSSRLLGHVNALEKALQKIGAMR